ncbi:MAG: YbhB/YbcL family Raf kinase inhibitor-like protein [Gemmatimonadota bacterium]
MRISSPEFQDGGRVPKQFTCEGRNLSPRLTFHDVPGGAASLVLIMDDPGAPSGTFVHCLIWNLAPETEGLAEGAAPDGSAPGAVEGTNSAGRKGYTGPCPPKGHGDHHYRFTLYALDRRLELKPGVGRDALDAAMRDHVLAETRLTGLYARG